jgi:integrase
MEFYHRTIVRSIYYTLMWIIIALILEIIGLRAWAVISLGLSFVMLGRIMWIVQKGSEWALEKAYRHSSDD